MELFRQLLARQEDALLGEGFGGNDPWCNQKGDEGFLSKGGDQDKTEECP